MTAVAESLTATHPARRCIPLSAKTLLLGALFAIVFDGFSLGPLSVSDALLLLGFLVWMFNVSVGHRKVYGTKWLAILGVFFSVTVVSIVLSDDLGRAVRSGFSILAMCALSCLVVNVVRDEKSVVTVIKCLIASGALVSASALLQAVIFYATGSVVLAPQLAIEEIAGFVLIRPTGFYWDPNYLGLLLILPLLMGGALYPKLSRGYRVSLGLILASLLLTLSRGVLLPFGALLSLYALHRLWGDWRRGRLSLRVAVHAIGTVLALSLLGLGLRARGGVTSLSAITRAMLLRNALSMVVERPFWGWGPGTWVRVQWEPGLLDQAESASVGRPFQQEGELHPPHNTVLQILLWIGSVGFASTLAAGWYMHRLYASVPPWCRPRWLRAIALGCVGFLLTGLFLDGFLSKQLWVSVSLLVSGCGYLRRQGSVASLAP